jgi:putative salt-induced outer membrane protein YdiY
LSLKTDDPIKVELSDETDLEGVTETAEEGKMRLKTEKIVEPVSFDLAHVKSINKAPEPSVKLKGHANVGISTAKGNTDTGTQHFDGEFVARTAKNRYTLGAEYNRAEDQGEKTEKNALGFAKYDHFLTKKWYFYSNASFEKDEFKDINLRSAIGAGMGYQFLETALTNLSFEAGLSYVNEDFELGQDDDYPAGRWSLDFDRYFLNKVIQFFHFHEGFVGLEDTEDLFIRSRTGLRLPVYKNIKATTQFNFDWDNSPAPGRKRRDYMYLFTLGYHL